jgi:pimeloyl-ACP methyl ester carboxylesterase
METRTGSVEQALHRLPVGGGLSLAVETRGAGRLPVLFAHGYGQSREAWTRAAESLA